MASDFLKKQAQAQAQKIDREYGADAYGGSNWRAATLQKSTGSSQPSTGTTKVSDFLSRNAAQQRSGMSRDDYDSSVRQSYAARAAASESNKVSESEFNRSTAMQQKYGSYANYKAGATADGKYYSQPDGIGANMDKLYNTYSTYEAALKPKAEALERANKELERLQGELETQGGKLEQLYSYAQQDSTGIAGALFEQAKKEYADTATKYETAAADADGAWAAYQPAYDKYVEAANAFESYRTEQQEAFDIWKSRIRGEGDVQADIDAAQAQIDTLTAQQKALEKQAQQLMGKVSSRSVGTQQMMELSQQAADLRTQASTLQSQIDELQGTMELLGEERGWVEYFSYADLAKNEDFADKSKYNSTSNGREAKMSLMGNMYTETGYDDTLYECINGNKDAQGKQMVNDVQSYTTHSYLEDLPEDVVKTFNYLYTLDTENGDAEHTNAYAYIEKAVEKQYTGIEAGVYGLLQGTGLASASATLGKGISAIAGDDEMAQRNNEWYSEFMQDAAAAHQQHPGMYTAGSIGGNLALLYGTGAAAGAGVSALTKGVNLGKYGLYVKNIATGALTFAAADAAQNAGAAATGNMTGEEYLKSVGVSAAQGMAGSLAGGLVSTGMADMLRNKGLMTPFMEFVRQTATGTATATANQAVGYAFAEEKPTTEEIAVNFTTAFLLSVLQSGISTYKTTAANKSAMEQAVSKLQEDYSALSRDWNSLTPEARAQRAEIISQYTQQVRTSLNSYYMAGQQETVTKLNGALDMIDDAMQSFVNGFSSAQAETSVPGNLLPGGGAVQNAAGAQTDTHLQRELATAMEQGLAQAQQEAQKPTQPTQQQTGIEAGTMAAGGAQAMTNGIMLPTAENAGSGIELPMADDDGAMSGNEQYWTGDRTSGYEYSYPSAAAPKEPAQYPYENVTINTDGNVSHSFYTSLSAAEKAAGNYNAMMGNKMVTVDLSKPGELGKAIEQARELSRDVQAESENRLLDNGMTAEQAREKSEELARQQQESMQQPGMLPTAEQYIKTTGGMNNGEQGYMESGTAEGDAGAGQLSDGDRGRISGESAGGQSGILAEGRPRGTAEQSRTAIERQNTARALQLEALSGQELGVARGTDAKRNKLLPEDAWDEEMTATAERVYNETGKRVSYVTNNIQINKKGGGVATVRAVISDSGVIIQADHLRLGIDQIADHEIFHDYADENPGLLDDVEHAIVREYSREELDGILETYIKKLRGIVDIPENASESDYEDAMRDIKHELFADAYAGINAFGAHAEKYREQARQAVKERGIAGGMSRENAAATGRKTAPPTERLREEDGLDAQENAGYNRFSNDDGMELRGERENVPDNAREWHAFNRSFANKTTGMKPGEERSIIIFTADNMYRVTADGYMSGYAEYKEPLNDDTAEYKNDWRREGNGTDEDRADFSSWPETVRPIGRRPVRDNADAQEQGRGAEGAAGLSGGEPTGQRAGSPEEIAGDYEEAQGVEPDGEYAPGSLIYDGEGGTYKANENGLPVKERFDLDEPVEQTETLLALHNMDEEKLRRTLNLGAWPSPSIAIVEAAQGHSNYGEFSAVFPRSVIDPETDSRNKVYGSDAWTPTWRNAQVEYEVDYDTKKAIENNIRDLSARVAGGIFARSSVISSRVDDTSNMDADTLAEKLAGDDTVRAAYLAETGGTLEPVMKSKEWDDFGNEALQQFIDEVGVQELARIESEIEMDNASASVEQYTKLIQSIIREDYRKSHQSFLNKKPESIEKRLDSYIENRASSYFRIKDFIEHAWKMYEDGGATTGDIDRYATEDALRAAVNDEDVAAWVRGQMDGLMGEPGIYNGKERYKSSGDSKSFSSLHWPFNAENIVRAMNQAEDRGEGYWGASAEGMMAMATPQYGSVDEMHADETRLYTESEEDRKARFAAIDQQIQDIIGRVRAETKAHASSSYEENDIIGGVLMQAATGDKSASGIRKTFKREGYAISEATAQDAADMYAEAAQIPTGYFEAKPQRVVDFDEALAVVSPDDAPIELLAAMRNAGMNVVEYQAGDEQSRLDIINGLEGARFSYDDEDEPTELALPGNEEEDAPVKQGITSAKTSIKQVPALFKDRNASFGDTNIDIGGGRFDLATDYLAERGTKNMVFDPYNRSEEVNTETLDFLMSGERADTSTCANVLNVIAEKSARANVILEAAKAIKPDGAAYFMVYEGDGSGIGKETSAGWQNNRKTADYTGEIERYFDSVERKGKLITATRPKENLPKASWEVQPGKAVRYSTDEENVAEPEAPEKPKRKKKETKPVAESLPIIAKRDLRQNMLGLFSIPEGMKAELGGIVDQYAERMIRNGALSQKDRDEFFDRMYAEGVMNVEADDYYREARSSIADRRIYVNEGTKHEFSDDWNSFRKRAFAAGVYLTNNPGDTGVDVVNMELADSLPGLFDEGELDMRTILERIVQLAEEGRDEKVSLAEYTSMLAEQEYVSEDEILDNMERQMDWVLRTFAEKAHLEIKLRDRTGVKIAQEREKFAAQSEKQRTRETERRAKERDARREMAQRQKEHKELRELQQRTLKQLQWLSKNSYRAPEELKAAWDDVLGDIDIYAAGAANETQWSEKYQATWKDLAQMYKTAKETDQNFLPSKELERIVSRLDSEKIADMDIGALQDLYKAAVGLRTEFYNRNNVIDDEQKRMFAEVYTDAKNELEGASAGFKGGIKGAGNKLFNDMQLTPMNLLERMADWNPGSAWYSMARQLEEGERAKRRFEVEAKQKLESFLKEHGDWVKKADGQGKDAIWYELEVPELLELGMGDKPIFGDSVKVYMTPAQKVHMYLESKNYDNLRHMTGGRTFVDKKLYSEGKRQEAFAQGKTIRLAPESVKKIVSDLTPEEQALAAALDAFYNGYATEQINRVSNILYGYDKAMGKNYAPIYTNQNYVKSEAGIYDVTAEGVGNLKGRVYSKNPSYNISAFDAFERNVEKTARFVGMAIPVRNWNTLMNWREKNNSMADVVTHKWGEQSKRFIDNLLVELQDGKDINKSAIEQALNKALSQYISSVFGFNPSIVLKQAASFPLAAAYLDWSNMPNIAKALRVDDALIGKYTGELAYRLMGYATPETAQLKNNPTKLQQPGIMNFVFGGGAITAMDGWTVKTLWSWAENKVKKEQPELKRGTQAEIDAGQSEYYKAVAKEFEEAVSRSQPMYDVMHRSNIMRESGAITRTFTLFKTVPQQEYNMLRQAVGEAKWHKRNGSDKKTRQKANKKAGRAFMGILVGNLMIGAITFLNAILKNKGKKYRDEDGELTLDSFMEQFMKQYFSDNAGVLLFGDTASEMLGSILAGDKWYGIETPGIEQLGTIIEGIISGGQTIVKLVQDSIEVLETGGDWAQYMRDNSETYMSAVDEVTEVIATYFGGIPATNVKGYLLGALQWMSPEIKTAYEDLLEKADKSGLKGLSGDALNMRLGNLLTDRIGEVTDNTVDALAALYENGYTDAVPTSQKTKLSINGEDRELNIAQQQTYKNIWSGTVRGELDALVGSDDFQEADEETQAKMLDKLYDYATEQAKAALFDDYELDSGTQKANDIITAGASAAEWAAWAGKTNGLKDAEKYEALAESGYSESVKKAIVGSIMGTEMTTESGNPSQYAKMLDVVQSGLKVNDYLKLKKAEAVNDYLDCIDAGLNAESALNMALELNALEPEDGKEHVSDAQKWRAAIDSASGTEGQMAALQTVMSESQFTKLQLAGEYGIEPAAYVTLKETLPKYDADGNGSYKNAEVQAAIDGLDGGGDGKLIPPWELEQNRNTYYLTNEQKAALWQIWTGSTSAKNNPYSTSIGQQVLDRKNGTDTSGALIPPWMQ